MAIQGDKKIDTTTFAQIEEYFSSALAIDENKRMKWLEKALQHDASLLREVHSLLLAHHESDTFLTTPLPLKKTIDEVTQRCPDLTGRRLGVYEVTHKIARGGMGRIYSAKRIDGEYEQVVAIKVVEVANINIELFLKERQLLADIHHPNIVTLLDGGTLEEGFPYLVMELVDGIAIDEYVSAHHLSSEEIVKLCSDLCQVVDDAHQQGIIHCDLKPDNILVISKGSRQGTLKLLDFGIAQSISASNATPISKSIGITPEYASPQRHQRTVPHNSDDVFSLGVIFGQLLSDQPLSLIQKTDAVKKSYRTADINALIKHIDNKELVQILRKATADKRHGRYASAKAFQADLDNWLDEKPISAAQGGWWYFYSKYIYRYRNILFIISIFVLGSVTLGQVVGQYFEKQESEVLRQEDAVEAVDDLDRLLSTIPHTPSLEKEVTILIVSRLKNWEKVNPDNPTLKKLYAEILIRMANISGHPYYLNLGNIADARSYYETALSLYEKLEGIEETQLESSIQKSAKINQIFIRHRLAELSIYNDASSATKGWKAMRSIREELNNENFISLSRKQQILILNMLLAGAYESLRVKAYEESWDLLAKARKIMFEEDVNPTNRSAESQYLHAFYYEIKGHLYFLEGNVNAALSEYSKIVRPNSDDDLGAGRYQYLLIRVDSASACMGFQQKSPLMKAQHFKYFDYARIKLESLANEYHDVPALMYQSQRMNISHDVRTATGKDKFCADPIKFLLPAM